MNGDDTDEMPTAHEVGGGAKRQTWSLNSGGASGDEDPTKTIIESGANKPKVDDDGYDDSSTKVVLNPAGGKSVPDISHSPVGWLALIDGPGFPFAFPISYGANRIGRGGKVEVSLDFGDKSISRGPHCRVVYDTKNREFFLQPGEGTGITYLDGQAVLAPMKLNSHQRFEVGHTTLMLVPLCSADFDWRDMPAAQGTNG